MKKILVPKKNNLNRSRKKKREMKKSLVSENGCKRKLLFWMSYIALPSSTHISENITRRIHLQKFVCGRMPQQFSLAFDPLELKNKPLEKEKLSILVWNPTSKQKEERNLYEDEFAGILLQGNLIEWYSKRLDKNVEYGETDAFGFYRDHYGDSAHYKQLIKKE
eukprot:CAMPEP_0117882072 /NCGR_PEP_ID=MMETSP0950-20121206/17239_1 /TAXON_ID=44440 /ORGANISM="Chattonella subsalsa, Strain CCMP2191" /LENGTH=163 /DNA_ID=CAMNT_0005737523 /DNA_START=156 /DNA_END=647 /DNA_ORIENTATION=+